jgi:hypothetical protein
MSQRDRHRERAEDLIGIRLLRIENTQSHLGRSRDHSEGCRGDKQARQSLKRKDNSLHHIRISRRIQKHVGYNGDRDKL